MELDSVSVKKVNYMKVGLAKIIERNTLYIAYNEFGLLRASGFSIQIFLHLYTLCKREQCHRIRRLDHGLIYQISQQISLIRAT